MPLEIQKLPFDNIISLPEFKNITGIDGISCLDWFKGYRENSYLSPAVEALMQANETTSANLIDLAKEKFNYSPIHLAAIPSTYYYNTAASITFLKNTITQFPNYINTTDTLQLTPLHYATMYEAAQARDTLLERGADPKVVDSQGNTPMHYLPEMDVVAAAKFVKYGANPCAINNTGAMPEVSERIIAQDEVSQAILSYNYRKHNAWAFDKKESTGHAEKVIQSRVNKDGVGEPSL